MPSGGARSRSGPAPDPDALRRNLSSDKATWTHLPAAREGPPPDWPLTPKASNRELEHWTREWARPQAVMWEANGQAVEVALYVRRLAEVERPRSKTTLGILVKQQQEYLGLSVPGLARHRWIIDRETEPTRQVSGEARASARERFKVVSDAG